MRVLIIDNYDSFTYNLVHYCQQFCEEVSALRPHEIDMDDLEKYDKIIISPGPGLPEETPLLSAVLKRYAGNKPILGVCLGMQAIAQHYGGELKQLKSVKHGVRSLCIRSENKAKIFKGLPASFLVGHYHSWVVNEKSLPAEIEIIAKNEDGLLMAIQHHHEPVCAVQFHPESVLTEYGLQIIQNWITLIH